MTRNTSLARLFMLSGSRPQNMICFALGAISSVVSPTAAISGNTKDAQTLIISTQDQRPALDNATHDSCLHVREIHIHGLSLVDAETMRKKIQPLACQCMDSAVKEALIRTIDETHSAEGYVTTKSHIVDQNANPTTKLDITIVTGRIGKIIYVEKERDGGDGFVERFSKNWKPLRDSSGPWNTVNATSGLLHVIDHPFDRFQMMDGQSWPKLKVWGATHVQAGAPLDIDEAQQAIDVFNSLPSNRANYRIVQTDAPAISDLEITNERQDSFTLVASYEHNGASLSNRDNTIDKKVQFELAKDNLIGINERWRSIFAIGPDNTEVKGFFTVPWRRFSFELTGGYFESNTQSLPLDKYYYRSTEVTAKSTYLLEYARTHNTKLEGTLGWRRIERDINSLPLPTKQISTFRFGFLRSHYKTTVEDQSSLLLGREYKYGLGVTAGLPILGASQDGPALSMRLPHTQFWKVDGKAELKQDIRKIGALNFEFKGQWSPVPLFSDDQLSLGSIWNIRGFINTVAKVDRGALLRTEFLPNLPVERLISAIGTPQELSFINDMLRATQPYIFYDTGYGRNIALRTNITRSSFGGGIRTDYGRTKMDLSLAHRLVERGTIRIPREPEVYFTISTKLM